MIQTTKNRGTSAPVPVKVADISDGLSQLQAAITAALRIPAEEFPTDKELRIELGFNVILIPDVNVSVALKE